jgi:hypothetical protein
MRRRLCGRILHLVVQDGRAETAVVSSVMADVMGRVVLQTPFF